ncbi:MAG: glutamine synthetase family protein [Chloroflexi bacterium]|nr:glutamine synthetase family protein [Chloroflexota bacterium]MCL5275837.1 glutamine synthetase family protein [Chloroflexota bacterium]
MQDDSRAPDHNPDDSDYASNKASALDYVMREARDAGVRLVRCLWADLSSVIRGRAIHVDALRRHMLNGIGIPASSMGLTTTDIQAIPGLQGQVRLLPDPTTFRLAQYAPNTALMLADLYETDLQPWALCPRSFLKRLLADLTDQGLRAQIGFEIEFYFAVRTGEGNYIPVDESLYASSVGMTVAAKVINDIVHSLDEQQIGIDHYHPESGHGQQELALLPADPLTACDRVLLVREAVRSIAWSHGWYASFAAKPFEAQPASSLQAHVSLRDRYDRNVMYRLDGERNRESTAQQFGDEARWSMAGLLRHMQALTALACPTVNSYRRLLPTAVAPPYAAWGFDNRHAMLRIEPLSWREGDSYANFEVKLADGSANPYLLVGNMLAAFLDGLANHYELPEAVNGSPGALEPEERMSRAIAALPTALQDACDLLEKDTVLAMAMGSPLHNAYLDVKRQEVKAFEGVIASLEQSRYYWKF